MKRHAMKKKMTVLAVFLCAVMLLDGPLKPMAVFASLGQEEQVPEDDLLEPGDGVGAAEEQAVPEEPATEPATSAASKYQSEIDKINDQMEALKAENAMIEQNINEAKSQKEKEQANKSYIDRQISITKDEITLLEERIALLEQDIVDKLADIDAKQEEFDENYAQFLKRLRSMQLSGEATQLGAILGSDNFADYLSTSEMMGRIAEYDQNLMVRVKAERKTLEEEKEALESAKTQVEADRAETKSKEDKLAEQQRTAELKIQDIDELQRQFTADLAKNQQLQKEMQAELDQIYKQIEWDKNPYVGGSMNWPLPNYTNITSYYGWRFGGSDFHTGIDISGSSVYGKPIVAANDGKVAFVNWSYTANRGYGIYLIIDHGGNTSTLYGHCSNIVVSVGDVVKKGDKIAEVGSTGWSTGPHLHFEIRENGAHQDPLPYLKG